MVALEEGLSKPDQGLSFMQDIASSPYLSLKGI